MPQNFDWSEAARQLPLAHIGFTAVALVLAVVISRLARQGIKKLSAGAAEGESFLRRFLSFESRFISKALGLFVWLAFVAAALSIWSEHIGKLASRISHLYPPLLKSIFIVTLAVVALKAIHQITRFMVEQLTPLTERGTLRGVQRVTTLDHTFRYGATILVMIVTVLMLMGTIGIDLKAMLATVGIASLAIGFGAQSLVKDIVSGIFILIEDQFAVGDVVVINGEGGLVERMTLRITQLRNTEGTLITISNGEVHTVKNMTSEWSRVDYKIGVAYETDLDRAMEILTEEARTLRSEMSDIIIDDPEPLGVDEFCDSSITLRIWIKTLPLKQWVVRRAYNRRVHKRFDKEGIVIPFPQRTLWIKEPAEALLAGAMERSSQRRS